MGVSVDFRCIVVGGERDGLKHFEEVIREMNCSTCRIRADRLAPGRCLDNGCIHFASTLGIHAIQCDYSGYKCDTCDGTKKICKICLGIKKNHHTRTHVFTPKVCPACKKGRK